MRTSPSDESIDSDAMEEETSRREESDADKGENRGKGRGRRRGGAENRAEDTLTSVDENRVTERARNPCHPN